MSRPRRRFSSYLVIENWNVDDVQQFLEKNGFGECCEAFKKRNIDGHGFLLLTEGQLMLWKRELSLVNIRKISKLIQDLSQEPEKFVIPDSKKKGTTEPPVKTNQFSTFRPQAANQNSLQKSRRAMVSSKNTAGSVASIVSNMGRVGKQNAANNSSGNAGVLAKNGGLHVKNPLLQQTRNSESSSSCSDNCSWDTNFSDDEAPLYLNISDTEEKNNGDNQSASNKSVLERAEFILTQLNSHERLKSPLLYQPEVSPSSGTSEIFDANVSRPDREELQKPQVPRHSELSPSRNAMPGEPPPVLMPSKLPAPPIAQLQNPLHIEKIVSSLNMPAAVEKARSEQWDEEEQYESIDNENLPSQEAIAAFIQGFNSQKSSSQVSLNSSRDVNGKQSPIPTPCSQNNLQNGWSKPLEQQFSVTKASSPIEAPQLPDKSSKLTAVHKTCVVSPSKRLPPSIPITSRPLPPQPSDSPMPRSSSSAYREAGSMSSQEEEQYECVDHPVASQNADDGNLSDEYESIRDHTKGGATDYYLQPVAMQSSSERARPALPPKPNSSTEIPSLEPPSLPVRQLSEDLGNSSSSPGNSGDGVTGLFGELLRKVRNKPTYSASSTLEREKTPTPEVKKPQPLPPPDHKPPPPVHQNNQRPLPPTPESSKSPLGTKDHSNTRSRRGSRVTAITQMPWYHNVDRRGADELLRKSQDGTFLLRPSSQTQNPLSLTLWYNNRIYNISVRHRPDGKYALGYEKPNEQSFASIEELVNNYQSENLVLYSNGERTGRTLLTGWPTRRD